MGGFELRFMYWSAPLCLYVQRVPFLQFPAFQKMHSFVPNLFLYICVLEGVLWLLSIRDLLGLALGVGLEKVSDSELVIVS